MVVIKQHNRLASWVLDDLRKLLGRDPTFKDYRREVLAHVYSYERWDAVREYIETALRSGGHL